MPVVEILKRCQSLPQGHYLVFHSYRIDEEAREYYGSLDIEEAKHPQTILAYEMNGTPLLVDDGSPLRLRVETKLLQIVKWLKSIKMVEKEYDHEKKKVSQRGTSP